MRIEIVVSLLFPIRHLRKMTPNDDGVKIVKVGVIGTGLAGLTSAYLLQTLDFTPERVRFQVHIFDKVRSSYSASALRGH